MDNEGGMNDSRKLEGGEIVYLVKDAGAKWQIRSYEYGQGILYNIVTGEQVYKDRRGLPQSWKNQEFDSVEDAVKFVQQQIKEGKVPRNKVRGPNL